jgi:hypothetical protein
MLLRARVLFADAKLAPIAGAIGAATARLLDDLISACKQRVRHVDPLRLGRLEVDDQFKFRRLRIRNDLWPLPLRMSATERARRRY